MEADSTTFDNKKPKTGIVLPFPVQPCNLKLYQDIISTQKEGNREMHLVQWLQSFGLLPQTMQCRKGEPECRMVCKAARVVDRVQWACESCNQRLPIRQGSFFMRMQCSMLQVLQIILAWSEDADWEVAASFFDIKPKVVSQIYERLDQLARDKHLETQLGGDNSVVLVEMYPDCLNRLSPDTTDQPHVHRILMMADTKHIPTHYFLHVIKQDSRKNSYGDESLENKSLSREVCGAVSASVAARSRLVVGNYAPLVEGAATLQALLQRADTDMQHFLCTRIWRQAVSLCAASRDVSGAGAAAVQRYLDAALYRIRYGDGFYAVMLKNVAEAHTSKN